MCPLCLGTATFLISGSTSAGGLALVLLREHLPRRRRRRWFRRIEKEAVESPKLLASTLNSKLYERLLN
jgi:hypothetical protein